MKTVRVGFVLILSFLVQAVVVAATTTYLMILDSDSGRVLACLPLEAGAPFHFDFINSIYLAPVRETFVYTETGGISLVKVESASAGVFEYYGLPTDGTGVAVFKRKVGDTIRIRSLNYENHRLSAGGKSVRFRDFASDGHPLTIKVWTGKGCKP
jgi:hypothetical protein